MVYAVLRLDLCRVYAESLWSRILMSSLIDNTGAVDGAGLKRGFRGLVALPVVALLLAVFPLVAGEGDSPPGSAESAAAAGGSFEVLVDDDDDPRTAPVREFAGATRYETSLAAAQRYVAVASAAGKPVTVTIVASGERLIDAAAAAGLARSENAPILLTPSEELFGLVAEFIEREGITKVLVMGGPVAISDAVFAELRAISSVEHVIRVGGENRFDTAALIAERKARNGASAEYCNSIQKSVVLVVGDGESFADVTMAGPLSYAMDLPILLTSIGGVPVETAAVLEAQDIEHVVVVGGDDAIPTALKELGMSAVTQLVGVNSIATSVVVLEALEECLGDAFDASSVALVSETALSNGISAAPILGTGLKEHGEVTPVLLVRPTDLPLEIRNYLCTTDAAVQVTAIGGVNAIAASVSSSAVDAANEAAAITTTRVYRPSSSSSCGGGISTYTAASTTTTTLPAGTTALPTGDTTVLGTAAQCGLNAFTATPTIDSVANTIDLEWVVVNLTDISTVTIALDGGQSHVYASDATTTTTFNILANSVGLLKFVVTFTPASGKADCEEFGQLTLPAPTAPTTSTTTATVAPKTTTATTLAPTTKTPTTTATTVAPALAPPTPLFHAVQTTIGTVGQCGLSAVTTVPLIHLTTNTVEVTFGTSLITPPSVSVTITFDGGQSRTYASHPTTAITFNIYATSVGLVKWTFTYTDGRADCVERGQLTLPAFTPLPTTTTAPPLAAPTPLPAGIATTIGTVGQCGTNAFTVTATFAPDDGTHDSVVNTVTLEWTTPLDSIESVTVAVDGPPYRGSSTWSAPLLSVNTTSPINLFADSAGLLDWTFRFTDGRADCVERAQLDLTTTTPTTTTTIAPPLAPPAALSDGVLTTFGTAGQCGTNVGVVSATIDSGASTIALVWGFLTLSNVSTVTITLDDGQNDVYNAPGPSTRKTTFNILSDSVGLFKFVVTFTDGTVDCVERVQLDLT